MDDRVLFENKSVSTNDYNEEIASYATAFTVWASVGELRGNEKYEASQLTDKADIKIIMYDRSDVTYTQRISFINEFYNIYSIQRSRRSGAGFMEILAKRLIQT